MNVGEPGKESTSPDSPIERLMGATSEIPTSLASASGTAPVISPPVCSAAPLPTSEGPGQASASTLTLTPTTVPGKDEGESIAIEKNIRPSQVETKDSSHQSDSETVTAVSEANGKTLEPLTRVPPALEEVHSCLASYVKPSAFRTEQQSFVSASSSEYTGASASFSERQIIGGSDGEKRMVPAAFLSRPPPVPSLFRPPFSSRPPLIQNFPATKSTSPSRFSYGSAGPLGGNGFSNLRHSFNVPPSGQTFQASAMRSTAGSVSIPLAGRASVFVPIHSSGGPSTSLLHDSQARSYSFPRGPPPPPVSYGFGRNHSWPSETSGHSLPPFRPPVASGSPVPPPFLSSAFLPGGLQHRGARPSQPLRISKWVNPIPPDPDDGQQQTGEQELATKMLQIQSKRFYIDVKQNRRGRFMKVAEIGADGRRNQVFLALSTAAEFRDHLSMFSEFYSNLGPPNPDTLPEDGKLKSETMVKDNRRYYLDLKENSRGRFLRVSQTIARGGPRCQIAIPAQGMIEFRDALQELLEEFGTDDGGFKGELPEGRHMRVENKNFYFDIGQNNRGIYMRISEVKTNFRTAITIPEKSWSRFRDIFADYVDKMKEGGGGGGGEKISSESNK